MPGLLSSPKSINAIANDILFRQEPQLPKGDYWNIYVPDKVVEYLYLHPQTYLFTDIYE